MKNSSILKNELIFEYASGTSNMAKSLMAATYLFLNSRENSLYHKFETYCGLELEKSKQIKTKKLTAEKCMDAKIIQTTNNNNNNPINQFISSFNNLKWKKIFSGFYEYSFNLSKKDKAKLIKMDQGTKVPLHSHNGKEYILVLQGSFRDEYGTYSKGNLQINDSNIKHTPIASNTEGCICLIITEKDLVFFGPFAPLLNLLTFIKSIFSSNK